MSIQAVSWAISARVRNPGAKLLLIALANYADERGECWPSQERLERDTELSERTIRTKLKLLEDGGFLSREERRSDAGRRASDFYTLHMGQPANVAGRSEGPTGNPRPSNRQLVAGKEPPEEPSRDSSNDESLSGACAPESESVGEQDGSGQTASPPDSGLDPFEMFWAAYPRRVAKKAARRAWDQVLKRGEATADELIAGTLRYQTECRNQQREERFVKHPATWLNGGCWQDDAAKPPSDDGAPTLPPTWRHGQREWHRLPDGGIVVWGTSPLADDWRRYGRATCQGTCAYLSSEPTWVRLPQAYSFEPPKSPFPPR